MADYKYDEDIVDQPDGMLTEDAKGEKEERQREYEDQDSEMHSLASSMRAKWEEYKNARQDIKEY